MIITSEAKALLNDYLNCGTKNCDECKAHKYIYDANTTYCSFLLEYRKLLQNKINEVFDKN